MKVTNHPTSPFGYQLNDRVVSRTHTTCLPDVRRMTGTVTKVYQYALIVTWDSGKTDRFDKHRKPQVELRKLPPEEDWIETPAKRAE